MTGRHSFIAVSGTETGQNPAGKNTRPRFGWLQTGVIGIAILSQTVTVWITWPLWLVRSTAMPNLPVFDVPEFNFGWWMIASLLAVVFWPRMGVWFHLLVLLVATFFDQVRAQPQFLAGWLLIFATSYPTGIRLGRWYLASLWIWAGLHKLLSPDWHAHESWTLVQQAGIPLEGLNWIFAYTVALAEMGLGVLAMFRPRWAAIFCPLVHVGIAVFLSPLFRNWNYSVIPWNLATAICGSWVMWQSSRNFKPAGWEVFTLCLFLAMPAGFYVGFMDHGYAHVLYSGSLPRGRITEPDG